MKEKSEAFKRLANTRVNKALNHIRLIGNLSNQSNYDFSPEQVDAIFAALKAGVAECRKKFDLALSAGEKGFRLD